MPREPNEKCYRRATTDGRQSPDARCRCSIRRGPTRTIRKWTTAFSAVPADKNLDRADQVTIDNLTPQRTFSIRSHVNAFVVRGKLRSREEATPLPLSCSGRSTVRPG